MRTLGIANQRHHQFSFDQFFFRSRSWADFVWLLLSPFTVIYR